MILDIIRSSIFAPRQLLKYFQTRALLAFCYFLGLILLMSIPQIVGYSIDSVMPMGQANSLNRSIDQNLFLTDTKVVDGQLQYHDARAFAGGNFVILIGNRTITNEFLNMHLLAFETDTVNYSFNNVEFRTLTYEEFGLENFDFSDRSPANISLLKTRIFEFYKHTPIVKVINIASGIISNVMTLVFAIFLVAIFANLYLPFGLRFKMSVYISTVYAILCLFGMLLNIPYVEFVGFIVFLIYSRKLFKGLVPLDPNKKG